MAGPRPLASTTETQLLLISFFPRKGWGHQVLCPGTWAVFPIHTEQGGESKHSTDVYIMVSGP